MYCHPVICVILGYYGAGMLTACGFFLNNLILLEIVSSELLVLVVGLYGYNIFSSKHVYNN